MIMPGYLGICVHQLIFMIYASNRLIVKPLVLNIYRANSSKEISRKTLATMDLLGQFYDTIPSKSLS